MNKRPQADAIAAQDTAAKAAARNTDGSDETEQVAFSTDPIIPETV